MDEDKTVQEQADTQEQNAPKRSRRGRKPMTQKQKDAMARGRAEKKKQAENMKPEVYVQYQDRDGDVSAIVAAAREQFREARKRTRITDMKVYIKPEERAAYFVINETFDGKVEYKRKAQKKRQTLTPLFLGFMLDR